MGPLLQVALVLVLAVGVQSVTLRSSEASELRGACKIFTLWDYPDGVPLYMQKDVESWSIHSHGRCGNPVLINDTNVEQYIPDLPEEYWRLPDHGSKSDMIRYAVIYHNGGIYLDSDFLVNKDMDEILDKIQGEGYDLISYAGNPDCHGGFSSNFMGGSKGSNFHKAVWEAQKETMKSRDCDVGSDEVCCPHDDSHKCHVPWGGLGERVSHKLFAEFESGQQSLKKYCYGESEGKSFNPDGWVTALLFKPKLSDAEAFWKSKGVKDPMDRIAYHLFNAQGFQREYHESAIFDPSLVVGQLFKQSLGNALGKRSLPWEMGDATVCSEEHGKCHCDGKVYWARKFLTDDSGEVNWKALATFRDATMTNHVAVDAKGQIDCNMETFGSDPQINRPKHCYCQPRMP